VHRGVAQVARATAHMPFSTQVALPRKKNRTMDVQFHVGLDKKNKINNNIKIAKPHSLPFGHWKWKSNCLRGCSAARVVRHRKLLRPRLHLLSRANSNVYEVHDKMKRNYPSRHEKRKKKNMRVNCGNSSQVNLCSLLSRFDVSKVWWFLVLLTIWADSASLASLFAWQMWE